MRNPTVRLRCLKAGQVLAEYSLRYWTSACKSCALKARCTTGPERRISRWEHEGVLEKVQSLLDHHPEAMAVRRHEHPFGTIKCWMGMFF